MGVKPEKMEFDPENLAVLAEIWKLYVLCQNIFENSFIASVCHTDYESRFFHFH